MNDVETTVEGSCQPAALVVPYDTNAWIVERCKDGRGRIGRSVIDDDELEVGHGLAKHALERRPQVLPAVVDGDEDGNERSGGHGIP